LSPSLEARALGVVYLPGEIGHVVRQTASGGRADVAVIA
jgi:hypothetical protein